MLGNIMSASRMSSICLLDVISTDSNALTNIKQHMSLHASILCVIWLVEGKVFNFLFYFDQPAMLYCYIYCYMYNVYTYNKHICMYIVLYANILKYL